MGEIHISTNAIHSIFDHLTQQVYGIKSISPGIIGNIAKIISAKSFYRGVDIKIDHSIVMIQLSVIVEYGCKMHLVCRELQNYLQKKWKN
ncbi:Asp23/Gls24 family envelope stress response protein [Paenibacillus sp. DCT19]|uniref:Asp23/Gls24 family envelope stress response protein n=1 Tax=Paenibacillus sp. DCT19 TaxID=2211212 RepID=UPI000FE1F1D1